MKFLRYEREGRAEYGVLEGETVYELKGSPFAGARERGAAVGAIGSLKLLAPCLPSKIICAAKNYPWGENPAKTPVPNLFYKPPSSLAGPGDDIVCPPQSKRVIFESELTVVIGRLARNVPVAEAGKYILGYTCGNDVTAYDLVLEDGTTFRGKSFDTFCPLGPVIASDLHPSDVTVTCRVNGEVRASGSPRGMFYSCEEIVSYASSIMTLLPGDVIMTGTPDIGELKRGDVVEVDIEGIGILRNRVV